MAEKSIEFKYIIEKKDYNALRTYYMYRRTLKRTKIMVIILLSSLVLLAISHSEFAFPFFRPIGLTGILAIAVIYSWISIDTRKLENKVKATVNKKLDLYLDEKGLSISWPGLNQAMEPDWKEMDHAYENDFYFFLFSERHFAVIIPKILMKELQTKAIRQLLEAHIPLVSDVTGYKYSI